MNKTRLEAFSDGVIAIIITIMVLELKVPHDTSLHALATLWPVFISYVISFVYVGIYWGNHHHLLHTVHHVNSRIIWANLGLLFCLSLVPFTSGWMGENIFSTLPLIVYALNLAVCAITYYILQQTIMTHYTLNIRVAAAIKKQKFKGILSLVLYIASAIAAQYFQWLSILLIIIPAVLWVIPDKNIEAALYESDNEDRKHYPPS